MKTFKFNNGETRLESQLNGRNFKTACIMWGCFDKQTREPLPYVVSEATQEELEIEKNRLVEIQNEFNEISEYNNRVDEGNEKLANATNINEFLNAYK